LDGSDPHFDAKAIATYNTSWDLDHLDPAIECPQIVAAIEDFKPTVLIGINGKALKAVWARPDPRLVIDLAENGIDRKRPKVTGV
jgi:hypothetical protein